MFECRAVPQHFLNVALRLDHKASRSFEADAVPSVNVLHPRRHIVVVGDLVPSVGDAAFRRFRSEMVYPRAQESRPLRDKMLEVINVNTLTVEIALGMLVVLALFGFFLRRVSQEQSSVEKLSDEIDSMERQQRLQEAAALEKLKKSNSNHE